MAKRPAELDLNKIVSEEQTRKTFAGVFNEDTIQRVYGLVTRDYFRELEYCIATGKESNVFRAVTRDGKFRAVKIFRQETSMFKNVEPYIRGDRRFENVRKNLRSFVKIWCQKEFRNLNILHKYGVSVPKVYGISSHVLVMEFIGDKKGNPAPQLKEAMDFDVKDVYEQMVQNLAKMVKGKFVHGDLSEYNILLNKGKAVIIDVSQGVMTQHPKANEFFERDMENLTRFFTRKGLKVTVEEMRQDIRDAKEKL